MQKVTEVLEGLRAERSRLLAEVAGVDRAIAALEEVLGIRTEPPAPAPEEPAHAEPEVAPAPPAPPAPPRPAGPYAKAAGLYEAVAAYLREAGEPRTARQIADALRAGGYPTRANNFQSTVRTMLVRTESSHWYGIRRAERPGHWVVKN